MVTEPIEKRRRELLVAEYLDPLTEGEVGGHQGRAAFIALGEDVEEQLAADAVKGHEAELVEDQQPDTLEAPLKPGEVAVVAGLDQLLTEDRY